MTTTTCHAANPQGWFHFFYFFSLFLVFISSIGCSEYVSWPATFTVVALLFNNRLDVVDPSMIFYYLCSNPRGKYEKTAYSLTCCKPNLQKVHGETFL